MNLFVCLRPNHVLKSLMWSFYYGNKEDIFVLGCGQVKSMKNIASRMLKEGFNVFKIDEIAIDKAILSSNKLARIYNLIFYKEIIKKRNFLKDLIDFNVTNVYLFYDQNFLSHFLMSHYSVHGANVYLLEDGLSNYNPRRPFKSFYRYLSGMHPLGLNKKIKNILLFYPERYTGKDSHKVAPLTKKIISYSKDVEHNKLISKIFAVDQHEFKFSYNEKVFVVVTQPLSNINILSNEEQVAVYSHIVNSLKKIGKVFIKTHPQDECLYDDLFQCEINGDVPFELIMDVFPNNATFLSLYSSIGLLDDTRAINLIEFNMPKDIRREVISLCQKDIVSIVFDGKKVNQ